MSFIRSVLGRLGSDDEVVQLFACNDCSNVFTRTWPAGERPEEVACPNCAATDVELAVESP